MYNNMKLSILLSVLHLVNCWSKSVSKGQHKLVIIMLDGFRWDYVDMVGLKNLPAFRKIVGEGARAEYVQPIFPAISFPSWTTIVTGLYAESHGMVGNFIYDPEDGATFGLDTLGFDNDTTGDGKWWKAEPIWITATKQGRRVSLYQWSKCDVEYDGIKPESCQPVSKNWTDMDLFRSNLENSGYDLQKGFDLVQVYYGGIDDFGHMHGPDSEEVKDDVKRVDIELDMFLKSLQDKGLDDVTNVVIVADHGMHDTTGRIMMKIQSLTAKENLVKMVEDTAFCHIKVKSGRLDQVYNDLKKWDGADVYKKKDIPDHLHFRNNQFILDILIIPHQDYLIGISGHPHNLSLPLAKDNETIKYHVGQHGFDDTSPNPTGYEEGNSPDMRTIMMAMGPDIIAGYHQPWIKLVDEYQVFCHLLGIEGRPHNGTWGRVRDMFFHDNTEDYVVILVIGICLVVGFLVILSQWIRNRCSRKNSEQFELLDGLETHNSPFWNLNDQ